MSSLARPFELASVTGNGMNASEQSTSYAAQARNRINVDFRPHASLDRTCSSYNTIGILQLTSGTPVSHSGFWTCCNCGEMNNEALSPERCSCCNHPRCQGCVAT